MDISLAMNLTQDQSLDLTQDTSRSSAQSQDESLETSKMMLVKMDIDRLIAQESEKISFHENDGKIKSDVWKRFKIVAFDGHLQDFASCYSCKTTYAWTIRSGTKSLSRHICKLTTTNKKRGAAKLESIEHYLIKNVPVNAKRALNKDITFGLAKDLKSLHTVEGTGFKYYAQALINLGARYGYQRVEDTIQHRTTLRNTHVSELCNDGRQHLKLLFQTLPSKYKFSFSKDLWSEKYQQRNFLSLSCHFIDNNWELHSTMLGLDEMLEAKNTGNIRERCIQILKPYFDEARIEYIIKTSIAVTDGGSNMLSVFENQFPCECHKLHLFVDWTLNENKLPSEKKILERASKGNPYNPKKLFNLQTHCPRIFESLTGVKGTVKYFKQSHLNATLPSTLKQAVATRWDSYLQMLESYVKVKEEVQTVLLKHHQLDKIKGIDNDLIDELIKFLTPIRKCSKTLSGDKYPTIQLVAVCFYELKEVIKNFEPQSEEMQLLLQQAKISFKEYVVILDIHFAACMLDPRYRQLIFATKIERRNAVLYLKRLVQEHEELCESENEQRIRDSTLTSQASTSQASSGTQKSMRFEKFQDVHNEECVETELPEVDRYLNQKFDLSKYTDEKGNFQILRFWQDMNDFPNLKEVARTILAIPAAETTDERNFSDAGIILNPRRTTLSGESLSELLFIHTSVEAHMLK